MGFIDIGKSRKKRFLAKERWGISFHRRKPKMQNDFINEYFKLNKEIHYGAVDSIPGNLFLLTPKLLNMHQIRALIIWLISILVYTGFFKNLRGFLSSKTESCFVAPLRNFIFEIWPILRFYSGKTIGYSPCCIYKLVE